ncbi:MAG: pesticidal protein Cry7Aa [Flavobacterium circumlabens]|uniref:glycoside hydrolase family 130 protein n=1 Tax=Flavobacterium circumlabens TaxID=2133765 RepID=UPI0032657B39
MISIKREGIVLEKTELVFENEGVMNPAVVKSGDLLHLFYRAVSQGNHSTIGYCKLDGPLSVIQRDSIPILSTEFNYESHGLEDPRIVKIEGLYYMTYTAFDGVNALGCLAVSKDLIHFEKKGIIVPTITYKEFSELTSSKRNISSKYFRYNQQNGITEKEGKKILLSDKNVIFFPRKINGKFCFMHRIKPEIQIIVAVKSLKDLTPAFYKNYFLNFNDHILLTSRYDHESSYVGGGCPPIETPHGWLIIYHGVKDNIKGRIYSACAALLDLDNPQIEIARLPYPLFSPKRDWELEGEVNNVCFPTGTAIFKDTLYIYYGAADEHIACVSVSLSGLINELMLNTTKNDN